MIKEESCLNLLDVWWNHLLLEDKRNLRHTTQCGGTLRVAHVRFKTAHQKRSRLVWTQRLHNGISFDRISHLLKEQQYVFQLVIYLIQRKYCTLYSVHKRKLKRKLTGVPVM